MSAAIDPLIRFGKAVVERGLLASTCGNVSLRLAGEELAVSASGSELGALTLADVAVVGLADGEHRRGPRPSMETILHRRVYAVRPRAGAILHCQSRAATLLACRPDPPRNLDFIPEVPAYVRRHAYVPWAPPGSVALADAVARAFEDPEVTVVQMQSHGQVILGSSWEKAVRRGVFFELACWMAVQPGALLTIPEADAAALRGLARDV